VDTNVTTTGVTFNGAAFTHLFNTETAGSSLYYLRSPAVTTANIVISYSAGGVFSEAIAVSYAGIDLTGFDGTSNTLDGTSEANYSSTVSTNSNNCWGVGFAHSTAGGNVGAGVSGSMSTVVLASTFLNAVIGDTNGPVSPAGNLMFTTGDGGGTPNIAEHFFVSLLPALTSVVSDTGAPFDDSLAVRSGNERRRIIW
jgi:hypothetical protein